jgi:hypothetical protein
MLLRRTRRLFTRVFVLVGSVALCGCATSEAPDTAAASHGRIITQESMNADAVDAALNARLAVLPDMKPIVAAYEGQLSDTEVKGLLLALNDEYHAWATYDQVIADHGEIRPFSNIRRSEARHINALLVLFEAYGIEAPENLWIGNVPSYASVAAAAQAGVEAEIANVELYDVLMASTARSDILSTYRNLRWASQERHLQAFRRWAP